MIRTTALALLVTVGFGFNALAQEAAPETPKAPGQELAETICVACHGADGTSVSTDPLYPHLAGQGADYMIKQLKDFKAGRRNDPLMSAMASVVATEQDERDIAAWYTKQVVKPSQATNVELVDRGRQLWRAGDAAKGVPACAGCHGASGHGLPAQYPRLAGQIPEYIAVQLQKFRNGERINDPESMMRIIAERLNDHDLKAVSEYAAGLR
ncbi:cytochrome c [Betaproteobacteria bacterium]|nr:cytochrome c [Betaproteobacteria bacterium]GHU48433.1 cytochrome c [Betaproteobacteria bacterium]